jgi:hypothetical protein
VASRAEVEKAPGVGALDPGIEIRVVLDIILT